MVFSSFTFLCYFLPIVVGTYYILPNRFRNVFLLWTSLLFYGWGRPVHLLVLLCFIVIGFYAAKGITHYPQKAKMICTASCFYILGIFFFFKYGDFALASFNDLTKKSLPLLYITLPLGISFYVFQLLSYVIDVYRQKATAQKSFSALALYVSSFPQLIAGPIVRYDTVAKQLTGRHHSVAKVYQGLRRFLIGLAKKVIIADMVGHSVDVIFASSVSSLTPAIAWLGAVLYALQIYFDFSGYSDMAIGLGRMFGFRFLENFNYPYLSKSISEFWRRWHISLSSWFKLYVYIPLGGNKHGLLRTVFNLATVFCLTGFWHGAAWTMVVWGLWQGFFVILEKLLKAAAHSLHITHISAVFYAVIGRCYALIALLLGWVIFRAETLSQAYDYIRLMFGLLPYKQAFGVSYYVQGLLWFIIAFAVIASTGVFQSVLRYRNFWAHLFINLWLLFLLFLVIVLLTGSGYNAFIYFRF